MPSQGLSQARAELAAAARWKPTELPNRQRDYRAAKLGAHIREVVDAAPPLTDEQVADLTALLQAGGAR